MSDIVLLAAIITYLLLIFYNTYSREVRAIWLEPRSGHLMIYVLRTYLYLFTLAPEIAGSVSRRACWRARRPRSQAHHERASRRDARAPRRTMRAGRTPALPGTKRMRTIEALPPIGTGTCVQILDSHTSFSYNQLSAILSALRLSMLSQRSSVGRAAVS